MRAFIAQLRRQLSNIWNRVLNPRALDARLELAIEGANDGLWDWNIPANRIYYSPRWTTTLGYERNEIGDTTEEWRALVHPEDLPSIDEILTEHFNGNTPLFEAEFRMHAKDGSYRWIYVRGISRRDSSGKPVRMAGSMTDNTLRKLTESALIDSERRYRSLFEATIEAIIIHKDGKILDVNHAFEQASGFNRVEAIRMSSLDLVAPESREIVREHIEANFIGRYEAVGLRKDGSTFPAEVHTKIMEYAGSEVRVTALRDITERQQIEAAERERRELAEALLDTARAMSSTLELDEVLDTVLANVGRVVPHTAADIMFLNGDIAYVVRTHGEALGDSIDNLRYDISEIPNLRRVIQTGLPDIVEDTRSNRDWVTLPETAWIRSALNMPVIVDGKVIALLNLASDQAFTFSKKDTEKLAPFASSAGLALHNARLYEAEYYARQRTQTLLNATHALASMTELDPLLQTILQEAAVVVPYVTANIGIVESDQFYFRALAGYDEDKKPYLQKIEPGLIETPLVQEIINTRRPILIPDVTQNSGWTLRPESSYIKSWLAIPLLLGDEVIGVLSFDGDEVNRFTTEHAAIAEAFASNAALAIARIRLLEAEREARQRAQALLEANRVLTSTLSLEKVLENILQQCATVLPYMVGAILAYAEDFTPVVALAGYSEAEEGVLADYFKGEFRNTELFQQMRDNLQPLIIPDVETNSDWVSVTGRQDIRSWMGVPLTVRGDLVGFLMVCSGIANAYNAEHAEIARAFAGQAAIAMHNAQLYQSEQAGRALAETLKQTAEGLASSIQLDVTLNLIIELLSKVVEYDTVTVSVVEDDTMRLLAAHGLPDDIVATLRQPHKIQGTPLIHLMNDGHPILMEDAQNDPVWDDPAYLGTVPRGWIAVPLIARGNIIGLLKVGSNQPNAYSQRDLAEVLAFGSQAAIAIENARLYQREQTERALAQTLKQTAEALASSIQLDATLNLIMDLIQHVVQYDTAAVSLIEKDKIRLLAARGVPQETVSLLSKPHQLKGVGLVELLVEGQQILLDDAQKDDRWHRVTDAAFVPRGWIGVPLIAQGHTVGTLTVGSKQPNAYSKRDLSAVAALASQAAVAIENARVLLELENSLHELRNAQIQLVRSARLSAAGEISLGVAHQINNPLTVIMAETHLMKRHVPPDSPLYESVDAIDEAARQAGSVVQRMLDFSRTHPVEVSELDVNESLKKAILLFRAQLPPEVSLVVQLDNSIPSAVGNEDQLGEVWLNLMLNARDAIGSNGRGMIKIASRYDADQEVIEVCFTDNGRGIAKEDLERVFVPFYTTKVHGTGLGLALSKEYITSQGGWLEAESEEGHGTTFTIRLPVARETSNVGLQE